MGNPVTIAGAGPAGLAVAYELARHGINPLVLKSAESLLVVASYVNAPLLPLGSGRDFRALRCQPVRAAAVAHVLPIIHRESLGYSLPRDPR
jgi:2-polyprenyl-6-methoxyphenol hydroxylase-like FAD-dependent oxidoreductase